MDEETIEKVKKELRRISEEEDISIDQAIVFGSRAREDYTEKSDVDIVLISEDFREVPGARRSREFYLEWNYEKLPEPEFICYTPEEFEEKASKDGFIAKTASEEGITIA